MESCELKNYKSAQITINKEYKNRTFEEGELAEVFRKIAKYNNNEADSLSFMAVFEEKNCTKEYKLGIEEINNITDLPDRLLCHYRKLFNYVFLSEGLSDGRLRVSVTSDNEEEVNDIIKLIELELDLKPLNN